MGKFTVFYSWQSDIANARTFIRARLRDVINRLEQEFSNDSLHIEIDEATRETAGSPNIPLTIFQKIESSDMLVCDMTIINPDVSDKRHRVANPNVLIELGYGVASIGWGRVVMVFNEAYGRVPDDLPFDVDRHRTAKFLYDYSSPVPDDGSLSKKERRVKLAQLQADAAEPLYDALKLIIEQQPPRPHELKTLTPEERKRQHDINVLRELMGCIHIPTMDWFLEQAPLGLIPYRIFHFWEGFRESLQSSAHHVYDAKLDAQINNLFQHWNHSLSFGEEFQLGAGGQYCIFYNPGDLPLPARRQKAWDEMQDALSKTETAFRGLLKYIRVNYIDVDLDAASRSAFEEYVKFMKELPPRPAKEPAEKDGAS